jgi:hypothetical protein
MDFRRIDFSHVAKHLLSHQHGLRFLALDVSDYRAFEFSGDDVNVNGFGLAESPASPNKLIHQFPGVRKSDEGHVVALLHIQSPSGDLTLGHEPVNPAFAEIE